MPTTSFFLVRNETSERCDSWDCGNGRSIAVVPPFLAEVKSGSEGTKFPAKRELCFFAGTNKKESRSPRRMRASYHLKNGITCYTILAKIVLTSHILFVKEVKGLCTLINLREQRSDIC